MMDPEKEQQEMIINYDPLKLNSKFEESNVGFNTLLKKNSKGQFRGKGWLDTVDCNLINRIILLILKIAIAIFLIMFIPKFIYSYGRGDPASFNKFNSQKIRSQKDLFQKIYTKEPKSDKVTSSEMKFPTQEFYRKTIQSINDGIQKKVYLTQTQFKIKKLYSQTNQSAANQTINGFLDKANQQLVSPIFPKRLYDIIDYKPYQQLPLCLFVKQTKQHGSQFHQQVAKSIFLQKYSNFITVFYGDQTSLTKQQLNQVQKRFTIEGKTPHRMFYKINMKYPNYLEYRYLMHKLCVQHSYILLVSSPLASGALELLNNNHQQFSIFLTASQDSMAYQAHAFPMRLFDLIAINDFQGTNEKYFIMPNQQKLISLCLLQLSKRFIKKIPMQFVYDANYYSRTKNWTNAIIKQDQSQYVRIPYQTLFSLSQNFRVNTEQISSYLNMLGFGGINSNNKSQIQPFKILEAIQQQQIAYLPKQYSLNKKMYQQRLNLYGDPMHYDKINISPLVQRSFCAVVFGSSQAGLSTQRKQRYIRSITSLLSQNYSNFHIVYYDEGLEEETIKQILQKVKEFGFLQSFLYLKGKNYQSRTLGILRASFEFCKPLQLQLVMDSDVVIIDPNYLSLANNVLGYQPDTWLFYTNYKTQTNKIGYPYRIKNDYQYRNFTKRISSLHYLPPLFAFQVRLIKTIPYEYHLNMKNQWLKQCWHKELQHSLIEKCSVGHIEYVPQIQFTYSQENIQKGQDKCKDSEQYQFVTRRKLNRPLSQLEQDNKQNQELVKNAISNIVSQLQ